MVILTERVDFDNRVVTVGTVLEKLLAESNNGLVAMALLAGKFINSVRSKERSKLFLVYSMSLSSFMVYIHLALFRLPFSC